MVRRQNGAALLVALVVVAIATVLATLALERSQRDGLRSQSIAQSERAYQYALGMESVAMAMIREAEESGMGQFLLDGAWTEPFEVPGGMVRGRVLDQSGRFNLNALAHPESGPRLQALQQLEDLLAQLALNPNLASELADWLEGTATPRPAGAGDSWYAAQTPAYRTAGRPMAHVSELRWLRSMNDETFQTLRPHVSALPVTNQRLNINNTTPEVLASFSDALDVETARRVLQDGPFNSLEDFLDHPSISGIEMTGVINQLTTQSEWFLAHARVELDQVPRDFYRLMDRATLEADYRYFRMGQEQH